MITLFRRQEIVIPAQSHASSDLILSLAGQALQHRQTHKNTLGSQLRVSTQLFLRGFEIVVLPLLVE